MNETVTEVDQAHQQLPAPLSPRVIRIAPGPAEADPLRHRRHRRLLERSLSVAVPVALIVMWQVASDAGWMDERYFPSPLTILSSAGDLIETGQLQEELVRSTRRIVIGFVLGVLSGAVAGFVLGGSRLARAAFEPTLNALYTVPKLALLPLFLLIFGLGEAPKIMLIVVTVFFFMWISTMEAVVSVGAGYHEAARSFGANRLQRFRRVTFPAVLPQMFVAMRVSAGVSVLVLIGAEFVQGGDGLGYLIWNSWSLFLADRMYVGIVVVALMGVAFSIVVKALGRLAMPWAEDGRGRRRARRSGSGRA